MINKTSVLIIQEDLNETALITEKCFEAGISEKNIFTVTESDSAERYLEIAGISYVIIDANMYNYVVEAIIDKFSEYFPIQTIITNSKPEQKTLRMMNNKTLTFVESYEEIPQILQRRSATIVSYPAASNQSIRNF